MATKTTEIGTGEDRQRPPRGDGSRAAARQTGAKDDHFEIVNRLLSEQAGLVERSTFYSRVRLFSFLAVVVGFLGVIDSVMFLLYLALPAGVIFAIGFVLHGRVADRQEAASHELTIITEARDRLERRRREDRVVPLVLQSSSPLEAGERVYAPEPDGFSLDAAVADDLELLQGARSLFNFLDWTSTSFGTRRLCRMLWRPLRRIAAIEARQEAVREIAAKNDIRDQILLTLVPMRQYDLTRLAKFFNEPPVFAGRKGLRFLADVSGTLAPLFLLTIVVTGRLEFIAPLVGLLLFNFVLVGFNVKRSNPVRDRLLLFGPLLSALARLRSVSRSTSWESEEWKLLEATLESVQSVVHRLGRYVHLLALHSYGVIFEIINVLTVWELRILPRADAVFYRHRELLEKAAGALGETEALICLALPLVEQTGYSMPQVLEDENPLVEAEAIGHPLLESAICVRNSVSLGGASNVWILTGSNMSGKSTYLKSVGLNLVLAGIGSAVCGSGFRWTPVAIHTDVNIRDSLDDGKSYFQVEVERLGESLRSAAKDPRLLILCDEMFRGTNSDERLAISRAVVRYLRTTGALVLTATHDRNLTRLVTEDAEPGIANYHLRDQIKDGAMFFDYRLREGVTPTRNAVRVLEKQEYPEEIIREAREFFESTAAPDAPGEEPTAEDTESHRASYAPGRKEEEPTTEGHREEEFTTEDTEGHREEKRGE